MAFFQPSPLRGVQGGKWPGTYRQMMIDHFPDSLKTGFGKQGAQPQGLPGGVTVGVINELNASNSLLPQPVDNRVQKNE